MNNFVSLKKLDKIRFLYEKLGVDYDIMRLIVSTKLTMDSRKPSNLLNNQQFQEPSNQYKIIQMFYAFFGLIMMFCMLVQENTFIAMTVHFSMFMFLMITIVMSDFSSVILDVKDKGILATKGVSIKTLNASKITHVMIYMINISIALNGFSLIASIKNGLLFTLVFLIEVLLVDIFMIVLAGVVYLILLKLFDGEKLKDIITIIQISVTVLFSIGYMFINNMANNATLFESIDLGVISYFLPPCWFAAVLEIIVTKNITETLLILSLLALVSPVISTYIYIKFIPVFEKNLQKLNNQGSSKKAKKYNLTMKLSKIICNDKEERIFFNFISKIIKNDRDLKTTVYPTIGGSIALTLYMIFSNNSEYINSYIYLCLYFYLFSIPTTIIALKYSRNYKASYIYTTIPIKDKMNVHKATIKSCLVNIIIPLYLIQCIIYIYFYKVSIIQHLLLIFLIIIFITINTFNVLDKDMPFSNPFNQLGKNNKIAENLLMTILTLVMAVIHFVSSILGTLAVNIYILVVLIINIFLFKSYFKMK